jgi:hypothetical protein
MCGLHSHNELRIHNLIQMSTLLNVCEERYIYIDEGDIRIDIRE